MRRAIFYKVESFSQADLDKFGTPSLITRNTNDVHQMQMLVYMGLNLMVMAPIMCIGGIIMALRQDVVLSFSIVIIAPLMAAVVEFFLAKVTPAISLYPGQNRRVNQIMREKLMGVRVIRAFVRNDYEVRRFDEANRPHHRIKSKSNDSPRHTVAYNHHGYLHHRYNMVWRPPNRKRSYAHR